MLGQYPTGGRAGNIHGGADLEGGKVDDRVDLGVFFKHAVQGSLFVHVDVVEGGAPAADKLYAVESFHRRVVEVVDNHDVEAGDEELERGEGADVASSAGVRTTLAAGAGCGSQTMAALVPGNQNSLRHVGEWAYNGGGVKYGDFFRRGCDEAEDRMQ